MNLLCLDAGNTRLKWGLHDGQRWLLQAAMPYAQLETFVLPAPADRLIACNVAGAVVARQIEAFARALDIPLTWFCSTPSAGDVRNGYENPAQLGADRWAALIGARARHGGAAVVVMAGTATTIDVLDAEGQFRGGLILPGLDLMQRALHLNTAALPAARGTYRNLPRNTDDAIVSGAIHATLGAIERMAAVAGEHAHCLLSGGNASQLADPLTNQLATQPTLPFECVDNLVLEGLVRWYRRVEIPGLTNPAAGSFPDR